MNRNVIYFPYIKVPKDEWFTRVLLYWDNISSIVPSEYADEPSRLEKYMYGLVQEELVKPIAPRNYIYKIPNFTKSFLEFVDNPEYRFRHGALERKEDTFLVHMEKLESLGDELSRRGLAQRFDESSYKIETFTANQFMAYLAAALGELPEIKSEPITNNKKNLYSFVPRFHQESKLISDLERSRILILKNILPGPRDSINPRELAKFKERYKDELSNFQNEIESFLVNVAAIHDPKLKTRSINEFINKTKKDVNDLSKKMEALGWRNITKGQFISCFVPGISLGLSITSGSIPGMVASAFTAYKMSTQTYRELTRTDFLEGKYAAYAVLASKPGVNSKNTGSNLRDNLTKAGDNIFRKLHKPNISQNVQNAL